MLATFVSQRFTWVALLAATLNIQLLNSPLGVVDAHSWIDCIDHSYDVVYTDSDKWVLNGKNGNGVCEGYPYKFPGRGVATIGTDYTHKLVPDEIHNDAPVCQYHSSEADYTGWRHVIHAKPGDKLYFAYFSNGHIVKDKAGPGTKHGIYWSGKPGVELSKPSELTRDRLVDGKLLDFDDGNCGQTYSDGDFSHGTIRSGRAGDFKPCVGSFTIPQGTEAGTYPMVWWWTFFKQGDFADNFAHFEGAGGAAYSSCFDVIVEGGSSGEDLVQGDSDILQSMPLEAPPAAAVVPMPTTAEPTPVPSGTHASTAAPDPTSADCKVAADAKPPTPSAPAPATLSPTAPTPAPTTKAPEDRTATPTPMVTATLPPMTVEPQSDTFANPLSAITYSSVGGSGVYGKVTSMQCPSSNACVQEDHAVKGTLAPFDEDLTLSLRGPLKVDNIAVFTKSGGNDSSQPWARVSSYSHANNNAMQNMVFLNNKGDSAKSGEFSMCHGNSQSYATADGSTAAASSTAFDGELADGVEVNVMSELTCAASGKCGFSRGVAHEGWSGTSKIFMVQAQMPHAPAGSKDLPAIWLLNGQVVRTAEYGCNCRGMGDQGKWKGGCGELDVAEVIEQDKEALTSTIYSFKGSRGTNPVTPRPTDGSVVFVVIFCESGVVQILTMRPEHVDLENPPTEERVKQWLDYRNGVQVNFDI